MTELASFRRAFLPVAGLMTLLLVAAPVLAAKPDKGPELARTLSGTVASSEDGKGRATFTMTVDGVVWELSAGPKWFWGANNPLAPFSGTSVTVTGTYHAGENDLDVDTVDGKALRAPGRPVWAGGPKVIGSSHPGWKDGKPGNGHGRDNAPGQLKNKDRAKAPDAD